MTRSDCTQQADGNVTAGNSSPISDGAAVLVLCSRQAAVRMHLPVLATIKSQADANQVSGCCQRGLVCVCVFFRLVC